MTAKECIARLIGNNDELPYQAIEAAFGELCGGVENTDLTDGLRITFQNGEIIHLRPSGNAPEFRCYNEADSLLRVENLNQTNRGQNTILSNISNICVLTPVSKLIISICLYPTNTNIVYYQHKF